MRLCVNWLPLHPELTRATAQRAEAAGLFGIGIGDSPHYGEVYAACADALRATDSLVVTTGVTNPVTRHPSVHASAVRAFDQACPGRFRFGLGRGDSAVHTFGLTPATHSGLEATVAAVRESCPDAVVLLAASGPATAGLAGRIADGVVAGVGGEKSALAMVQEKAAANRAPGRDLVEIWGSLRLAVGRSANEVAQLRRRLVPRAISAAHFAFASTTAGKAVPEEFANVLAERYAAYDYSSHGRSGATSNAGLFADRPDIEDYLLDRFAVLGTPEQCRDRLAALAPHVHGLYLSLLFEDAAEQIDRLGEIIAAGV